MTYVTYPDAPSALSPAWRPQGMSGRRLAFWAARSLRDEERLAQWSDAFEDLSLAALGLSVAVVGNARSLSQKSLGQEIDRHDIVLRINTAPMPNPRSHGTRTDWLASSIPVPMRRVAELNPSRVLWMTRKRKRLPYDLAKRSGFYLNPKAPVNQLADTLGAPPSTGAMVLELVRHLRFEQISVYGFDFFASLSNSGRRTAAQVPHDFIAERDHAVELFASDERFELR